MNTLEQQKQRAYAQYREHETDISKNGFLQGLKGKLLGMRVSSQAIIHSRWGDKSADISERDSTKLGLVLCTPVDSSGRDVPRDL